MQRFINRHAAIENDSESRMEMKPGTERNILDHAGYFHNFLANYYKKIAEETEHPRIKLLLEHLSLHEKYMEAGLGKFQEEATAQILETRHSFTDCEKKLKKLDRKGIAPGDSVDEVMRKAIELDNCLIDFYRNLLKKTTSKELQEIYLSLITLEESEKMQMVQDAHNLKDI